MKKRKKRQQPGLGAPGWRRPGQVYCGTLSPASEGKAQASGTMTHLQAGLSPETLEKARLELNENPDTLHQDIQEVRDMVITRPDIGFLRTDDAFILRFLRARKFTTLRPSASWPSTLSIGSRTWTCSKASRPPTLASSRP